MRHKLQALSSNHRFNLGSRGPGRFAALGSRGPGRCAVPGSRGPEEETGPRDPENITTASGPPPRQMCGTLAMEEDLCTT